MFLHILLVTLAAGFFGGGLALAFSALRTIARGSSVPTGSVSSVTPGPDSLDDLTIDESAEFHETVDGSGGAP